MALPARLADFAGGFEQLPGRHKLGTMLALAAVIALAVGAWLWSATPEYRVLYSNVSDRDGGAILAALAQHKVPHKMSEGGSAILVPADQVHDVRLRLASQGLPRGGVVGFELMENQKLGATQFQEQVNYQRALEGELARSIQTLSAVASARVHLSIPKPSVFLREQQRPGASVLVNLHTGRQLERAQVAGIAHLVASSVPDLQIKAVSVLDQHGNLLSASAQDAASGLDAGQLGYVQGIEAATIKRIADILEPITGRGNVRVQVTAELDFSQAESTAETYRPNQTPQSATVRSESRSDSSEPVGSGPQGVPGAPSNQPQAPGAAPVSRPGAAAVAAATRRESTINYEVDKTVRHVKSPVGTVKRLSAGVVVNYKKGKPLAAEELEQLGALAREAMGFSRERGDSINLVNAAFTLEERAAPAELALWQQPDVVALAKEAGRMLAVAVVFLVLVFGVLRPLVRSIAAAPRAPELAAPAALPGAVEANAAYGNRLASAKQIATSDPRVVANVVKTWVAADE
jgi:flagellar M-ring protein FliF